MYYNDFFLFMVLCTAPDDGSTQSKLVVDNYLQIKLCLDRNFALFLIFCKQIYNCCSLKLKSPTFLALEKTGNCGGRYEGLAKHQNVKFSAEESVTA